MSAINIVRCADVLDFERPQGGRRRHWAFHTTEPVFKLLEWLLRAQTDHGAAANLFTLRLAVATMLDDYGPPHGFGRNDCGYCAPHWC